MTKIYVCILFLLLAVPLFSQETEFPLLIKAENELSQQFTMLYSLPDSPGRDSLNQVILSRFREALNSWDSFFFDWEKIKNVGIFRSQDNRVRVYTWYLENEKGLYTYYGFVQHLTGKKKNRQKVDVFGLLDHHNEIKNPETVARPDTSDWYGCLYYGIHSFKKRKNNWYVLFGYEFNNSFSHKKLLDVLTFSRKGDPVFGGEFVLEKKTVNRFILEYSADVVSSLRYNPHLDMIVFDHLEPLQPILKGSYRFYSPDGSYDAFKFENGTFVFQKDVDARNY